MILRVKTLSFQVFSFGIEDKSGGLNL
jgi:hypothetical protein